MLDPVVIGLRWVTEHNELLVQLIPCASWVNQSKHQSDHVFERKCNCIVTRGGVYNEILPEPEGNPEGGARGISRGPDSSHNTVILNYLY